MNPILISISGKSGVGKTTISNILAQCLNRDKCLILSTDDLHKYERNDPLWETITHFNPKANNIELGDFHISQLIKNKPIHRSIYNHNTGTFNPPKLISPKPFIINEGLHSFYSSIMDEKSDFKIYVDTDETLTSLWKIKRDTKYRGKSEQEVLKSIELRKKDEHFIEKQKKQADLIIKFCLDKNQEINLTVKNPTVKSITFSNIIKDLINYFNDIKSLVRLSKKYGKNTSYIQGPAGNISVKCSDNMLIKSSGTQLKEVDYFTGWSDINTNYLTEYFSFAKNLDDTKYFNILNESVQNNTVPSMESGMHSLLKKYVIHTHPNELVAILSNKNCCNILSSLYHDIDYCFVPLLMPGLDLFKFISKQDKIYEVYFLQNHGLIVNSDNIKKLQIHDIICNRAKTIDKSLFKYLNKKPNKEFGYLTPDEYIFRECKKPWYKSMKNYYNFIKNSYKCDFINNEFLHKLDNLKFEKHRKSL
tara:strand:- start:6333 stop:7760 length:1428 start_codon:yes stop_codon:yes gene_type:complete